MEKLVVLTLTGDDFQNATHVNLKIWHEGGQYLGGSEGRLPPCPDLLEKYDAWQLTIRSLAPPTARMKIKTNTKGNTVEKFYAKQKENWYQDCRQAELDLVKLINNWLQSESFRPIQDKLHEKISAGDRARIIILTQNYSIKKLPWNQWQWLIKNNHQAEIILGNIDCHPSPIVLRNKIRILVILGNSDGIDIQTDLKVLSKTLTHADIETLVKPTLKDLNDYLWNQGWDILFFAGHSETDTDIGKLYISDEDFIEINDLRYALQKAINQGLKLAIFNSCDGLGLAYELEKLNIPNLIVMRDIVPDEVAQQFLRDFLSGFAIENKPLHLAFLEARKKLQGLEKSFPSASWTPVIFQNFADRVQYWRDWFNKKQLNYWKQIGVLAGVSLIITSLIMWGRSQQIIRPITEPIVTFSSDMLIRQRARVQPKDDRILIVEITKEEVKKHTNKLTGAFSDQILLKLINKLYSDNPRAIGLDIFRDEYQLSKDLLDIFIKKDNLITVFTIGSSDSSEDEPIPPPEGVPNERLGFADLELDRDDIVRRQLLISDGYYAFSFLLAFHYLSEDKLDLIETSKHELGFGKVIFPRLDTRDRGYPYLDGNYDQLLRTFRGNVAKTVKLTDILEGFVPRKDIEDKVILIGKTDPTYRDIHKTPIGNQRGLFIHAQMVSQILTLVEENKSQISVLPLSVEYLCIYLCCLLGGVIFWCFRSLIHRQIINFAVVFVIYQICVQMLVSQGIWISFAVSILAFLMTQVILSILPIRSPLQYSLKKLSQSSN